MRSLSKAIFSSAFEICKSSPEDYVQANQGREQTSVKGLIEWQVGQEDGDLDTEVDGAKSCGVASRHVSMAIYRPSTLRTNGQRISSEQD